MNETALVKIATKYGTAGMHEAWMNETAFVGIDTTNGTAWMGLRRQVPPFLPPIPM